MNLTLPHPSRPMQPAAEEPALTEYCLGASGFVKSPSFSLTTALPVGTRVSVLRKRKPRLRESPRSDNSQGAKTEPDFTHRTLILGTLSLSGQGHQSPLHPIMRIRVSGHCPPALHLPARSPACHAPVPNPCPCPPAGFFAGPQTHHPHCPSVAPPSAWNAPHPTQHLHCLSFSLWSGLCSNVRPPTALTLSLWLKHTPSL